MQGKIDKPGVYDIDIGTYHSQCCVGPSVSASSVKICVERGPRVWFLLSPFNPDFTPPERSDALRLGSLAHLLLLEPERFDAEVAVRPEQYSDWRKTAAKEWRAARVAEGKIVCSPAELEDARRLSVALRANPHAYGVLTAGRAEESCIWQDEETGLWLKARQDWLPEHSGRFIADYKSCADLGRFAQNAMVDFRYDIQGWFQLEGARRVAGVEAGGVAWVAQERAAPFECRVFLLQSKGDGARVLRAAEREIRTALRSIADVLEQGGPPPPLNAVDVLTELPEWAARRIGEKL